MTAAVVGGLQAASLTPAKVKEERFLRERFRWNTSEEIYAVLTSIDQHGYWVNEQVAQRPPNGSMLLYDRRQVNYRNDGYVWKKRKDGKQIREDHMKLKVKGEECIYGCYVHSALLPSFHRRCYWLLDNPDIILVHYLNMPAANDKGLLPATQLLVQPCAAAADKAERMWTPAEILSELEPMQRRPKEERSTSCPKTMIGKQSKMFAPSVSHQTQVLNVEAPMVASTAQWILNVGCQSSVSHLVIVNGCTATTTAASSVLPNHPVPQGDSTKVSQPYMPPDVERSCNMQSPMPEKVDAVGTCSTAKDYFASDLLKAAPDCCESSHTNDLDSLLFGSNIASMVDMSVDELGSILLDHPFATEDGHPNDCVAKRGNDEQIVNDLNIFDWPSDDCFAEDSPVLGSSPEAGLTSLAPIEFAPCWGLTSGGDKMLIIGPWSQKPGAAAASHCGYACRFGGVGAVPAELVSDGILRCTIPASGTEQNVRLQVEHNGDPVSDVGLFEYRSSSYCQERNAIMDWFCLADTRSMLWEKLAALDQWLVASGIATRSSLTSPKAAVVQCSSTPEDALEAAAVELVRQWQSQCRPGSCARRAEQDCASLQPSTRGLTLLHIAACLGHAKLIEAVAEWRVAGAQTFELLSWETSLSSIDKCGCTPLHWACALGKREAVRVLLRCAAFPSSGGESIHSPNINGLQPVAMARLAGHRDLADQVAAAMQGAPQSGGTCSHCCLTLRSPDAHRPLAGTTEGCGSGSRKPASRRASTPQQRSLQRMKRQSSLSSAREDAESCLRPVASDPLIPCSLRRAAASATRHAAARQSDDLKGLTVPRVPTFGDLVSMEAPTDADDGYIIDVETISDEDMPCVEELANARSKDGPDVGSQCRMRSLAERIIAAIPERIKTSAMGTESSADAGEFQRRSPQSFSFLSYRDRSSSSHSSYSDTSSIVGCCSVAGGEDSGIATPQLGSLDELRPASPNTTTEDFSEYFNANAANMERYFSSLTLSDVEQRKLYEAAKVIQSAYRLFKDKKQQHQREIEAAVIIQTYYRRYKKYKYQLNLQLMQQAAVRIQSQFRTYYARKRFRQSRAAALVIQHQYRAYRESERAKKQRQSLRQCSVSGAAGVPVALLPQLGKHRALSSRQRIVETAAIRRNSVVRPHQLHCHYCRCCFFRRVCKRKIA